MLYNFNCISICHYFDFIMLTSDNTVQTILDKIRSKPFSFVSVEIKINF